MAQITLQGNAIHTSGDLPAHGSTAPDFNLVRQDLSPATLATYAGKKKVLSIFPSLDTPVCAVSIKHFHADASALPGVIVLNVSMDLPFAAKRFCTAEKVEGSETLSAFRSTFASDYGVRISDGPLEGLCARAIVVLDEENRVVYTELVPEIAQEPNYAQALSAVKEISATA